MRRVEEQDGNAGPDGAQQVHQHHALRLEAGGDARHRGTLELRRGERHRCFNTHVSTSSRTAWTASTAAVSLPASRAARASLAAMSRPSAAPALSSGLAIIAAPAVKFVIGSMRMPLPVARFAAYGSN